MLYRLKDSDLITRRDVVQSSTLPQVARDSWPRFGMTRRRGATCRPWAFTEHGALQAANILAIPRAAQINVVVVRAFLKMCALLGCLSREPGKEQDDIRNERHRGEQGQELMISFARDHQPGYRPGSPEKVKAQVHRVGQLMV